MHKVFRMQHPIHKPDTANTHAYLDPNSKVMLKGGRG